METFKMAPVDEMGNLSEPPTKRQLRAGFEALKDDVSKAIYLFTATTGLRKCEIFAVQREQVDLKNRCVIPKHFTRKKRSGITFYSQDTEPYLAKYLNSRADNNPLLFLISDRQQRKIWRTASKAAKVSITPQVLRVWFSSEMGDSLIPDRYVDIFQGRAPRSVLAKHYTGKGLRRLKRIYDKAKLRIIVDENFKKKIQEDSKP
jgi:integrase